LFPGLAVPRLTQAVRWRFEIQKRKNVMKTFVRSTLFIAALAVGANGLMAAPVDTTNMSLKQLIKQTKALEATAEAPAQHKALALEYRQLAQRQLAESSKHAEMAEWYARFPIYLSAKFRPSTIDHCRYSAEKYRNDAQRSEKMAARHEALAS
jgi:hypothetical protein